jgi:serine/threonine protein kinase
MSSLGDGTYGCVFKALSLKTNEIVAIKRMKSKYKSWDECMQLREIKSLRKLSHQNLIKLKEVIKNQDELNLVFEYLELNLYQLYLQYREANQVIPETVIKSIVHQLASGL